MKTRIQIHVKLHETTDPFDSSCIIGFHGVVIVGGGGCARHVRLHNTHYSAVQCTQYPVQSTVGIQHSTGTVYIWLGPEPLLRLRNTEVPLFNDYQHKNKKSSIIIALLLVVRLNIKLRNVSKTSGNTGTGIYLTNWLVKTKI